MAQRNPMNDRYMGDGPQGKTRKSAAKLKPKVEAASTVHIEHKPTTKQERKAAQKKRDAQLAAKERERKRKAEERDRKQREAAGEVFEEPKPATMIDKVKGFFITPSTADSTQASDKTSDNRKAAAKDEDKNTAALSTKNIPAAAPQLPTWHRGPDTPEYRRLKYIYWGLLVVGIVSAGISLLIMYAIPDQAESGASIVPLALTYPAVIGALVLDMTKIKKMQRAHMAFGQGRQSPKQQKHAQQKAEAAALLEESKKAQKELKRANSKIPFAKGKEKSNEDPNENEETQE